LAKETRAFGEPSLKSFDYIIVGAGSSGAVLANRLSADPSIRVCLLEAGGSDASPLISTPLGVMALSRRAAHNWMYTTSPQSALNGREISVPRGKTLGGSSAINGMIYIRGRKDDYDSWARAGCTGWGYDDVLPYFKKSQTNTNAALSDDVHGRGGPLSVSDLRDPNAMDHAFVEAAAHLQIPACADFNTAAPEGVGVYQVTQKDGQRHSAAAAFLHPVADRPNLHVEKGATVTRLHLLNGRVARVSCAMRGGGVIADFEAQREVILCAGAIGSPDILLRSGIGGGAALQKAGVPVVHDLPGVGENLHDHVDAMVICESASRLAYGFSLPALPKLSGELFKWLFARRGMFSSNMVEAGGFVRTDPALAQPDIQFHFIPGRKSLRGRMVDYGHGVSLHTCVLQPKSRGRVWRDRADGPPLIDLGLLKDDADLEVLLKGVKLARRILAQGPLAQHGLTELLPGAQVQDDAGLVDFIRAEARTVYHPVGTCAMGTRPEAVVDPRLRVRGLHGLRVVDASIMPSIISGNTNAPAIMIAEKAADMILADAKAAKQAA
jgi:choline dehydrogenase-like flavoprotein